MSNRKLNCAVIGASGYVGLELVRMLTAHPMVKLSAIYSRQRSVDKFSDIYPSLSTFCELELKPFSGALTDIDVAFIAVPHGESSSVMKEILNSNNKPPVVIDLGADFRVSPDEYQRIFEHPHPAPELCAQAVYATPELFPQDIQATSLIANPGCFAHTIILALAPLVQGKCASRKFKVSAITGSSGGGVKPNAKAHHPERAETVSAYQVFKHRHLPEIIQTLSKISGDTIEIDFVPMSGPYVRGIFATCFAELESNSVNVSEVYSDFCVERRFMRLRSDTPKVSEIKGTNFCDLAVHQNGKSVAILATLDNLVKGAGGNAIQSMNIRFGLEETLGLNFPAIFP